MKSNPLVDLSRQYAVLVVNICNSIKERGKSNALVNQFIRSGTTIGANIAIQPGTTISFNAAEVEISTHLA